MRDDYIHLDSRVIYVKECIPGPIEEKEDNLEILENFNSQITQHCKCETDFACIDDRCCCILSTGGANYIANQEPYFNLKLSNKKFDQYPIVECNSLCSCSKHCGNRLVQNGPIDGLKIKDTGCKGLGLFISKNISKGTCVCEYAGEIITKATALKRQELNAVNGGMNYIYCLNEVSGGKVIQTFVDPTYIGNIGRYMNHSCEPNCQIIPVRVDTPIPKLAIFAMSDICQGDELTFHYGSSASAADNVSEINKTKKCLCKSSKCSKFMPYDNYENA